MSWLDIAPDSPFSLANIPFGIISYPEGGETPRPAVAVGEWALDLLLFSKNGGFAENSDLHGHQDVFVQPTLNDFASLGSKTHEAVRTFLQQVLARDTPFPQVLKENSDLQKRALISLSKTQQHLPMHIGDYTDFYAGLNHAYNVGCLFRGPENALQPNYKHLPVGYHGRASSVVVSGTPVRRPRGQILADPAAQPKVPSYEPCRKLDIELELGAFVSRSTQLGETIAIQDAAGSIFGYVLMNDWSARDIQAWEYVPLGPFLSKSFATTISPWVVLPTALERFRSQGLEPGNRDNLLPHLRDSDPKNCYDISLTVELLPQEESERGPIICETSSKNLLFSFSQMLAHHSSNGCPMNVGDLLGSGTISGDKPGTQGSLLEQTENGKKSIKVGNHERVFLQDGDEVVIRGVCGEPGSLVGFGECRGKIRAAG